MIDPKKLSALEAAARKATPGPWAVPGANVFCVWAPEAKRCIVPDTAPYPCHWGKEDFGWNPDAPNADELGAEAAANATFIAQADPQTVAGLVAAAKRLHRECEGCPGCHTGDCPDALDMALSERDAAREELNLLRQREQATCEVAAASTEWKHAARRAEAEVERLRGLLGQVPPAVDAEFGKCNLPDCVTPEFYGLVRRIRAALEPARGEEE